MGIDTPDWDIHINHSISIHWFQQLLLHLQVDLQVMAAAKQELSQVAARFLFIMLVKFSEDISRATSSS